MSIWSIFLGKTNNKLYLHKGRPSYIQTQANRRKRTVIAFSKNSTYTAPETKTNKQLTFAIDAHVLVTSESIYSNRMPGKKAGIVCLPLFEITARFSGGIETLQRCLSLLIMLRCNQDSVSRYKTLYDAPGLRRNLFNRSETLYLPKGQGTML